jgi:hypothetical protein
MPAHPQAVPVRHLSHWGKSRPERTSIMVYNDFSCEFLTGMSPAALRFFPDVSGDVTDCSRNSLLEVLMEL